MLWIALLWYASGAFARRGEPIVDRLRGTIVLGVAIPFVLGFCGLLYPLALWGCAAAVGAWRFFRSGERRAQVPEVGLLFTLAACVLVIWPPLARPPLDGDTLAYHLPNAFSWVQSHSVWVTRAPYWYYPGGSELFAAGLLGAAGRWSLPLAGALPALMLCGRVYLFGRERGAPAFAASAVALAAIFTPLAAFQTGSLQNDLWLAAFFVEVLCARATGEALAVCALVKPFGWIEAILGALCAARSPRVLLLGLIPFGAWIARDVLLVHAGASLSSSPPYWYASIAGNLEPALSLLAGAAAHSSPMLFAFLALVPAGLFFAPARRYAIAGCAIVVLYVFLPFSYRGYVTNYAADGSSLRFLLPALFCGALVAQFGAAVRPRIVAALGYAIAAYGAYDVLAIFWNDALARLAIPAALLALAGALLSRRTRGVSIALASCVIVLAGARFAQTRALSFYADAMRAPGGTPSGLYAWLARAAPPRILAQNLRTGSILMISPATQAAEIDSHADICAAARRQHAVFIIGSNEDMPGAVRAQHVAAARACGRLLFEDAAALAASP